MFAIWAAFAAPSSACTFLPPTVESSWYWASDTLAVEVLSELVTATDRLYLARVTAAFDGCRATGDLVLLRTDRSEASCGTRLTVGDEWLVFGHRTAPRYGLRTLELVLPDANQPLAGLGADDAAFLADRTVTCPRTGERCTDGAAPPACPVDPCAAGPQCAGAVRCETNACGGCAAEEWDPDGRLVCTSP